MFSARWSPDGRYLAAFPTDSLGMRVYDFQTKKWSTVVEHGFAGFDRWSKDSQWVYYINARLNPGVFRVHPTGGSPQLVVDLKSYPWTGYFGVWMSLDANDNPMLLRNTGTDDIYALTLGRQ